VGITRPDASSTLESFLHLIYSLPFLPPHLYLFPLLSMADETVLPIPNLQLPQQYFILTQPSLSHLHAKARDDLLAGIKADSMAPYYKLVTSAGALTVDESLLKELENSNEDELKSLEERLSEAEKMEGETDVVDLLRAKAAYLTKIGDKVRRATTFFMMSMLISCRSVQWKHRKLRWRRPLAPVRRSTLPLLSSASDSSLATTHSSL
jgi:hypothetical protein